jgi:hypothetical protein
MLARESVLQHQQCKETSAPVSLAHIVERDCGGQSVFTTPRAVVGPLPSLLSCRARLVCSPFGVHLRRNRVLLAICLYTYITPTLLVRESVLQHQQCKKPLFLLHHGATLRRPICRHC